MTKIYAYEKELDLNTIIYNSIVKAIKVKYTTIKNFAIKNNVNEKSLANSLNNKNFIRIDNKGNILIKTRILSSSLNTALKNNLENIIESILLGNSYEIE